MTLAAIIQQEIQQTGPIRFKDYMERCLYHTKLGYYCSPGNRIGKHGDYYTMPYLSTLFGHLIATQLEEMWILMGKDQFTVLEFGAGTGLLCTDILNAARQNEEFFSALQYCIVEKNTYPGTCPKSNLPGKAVWYSDISEIGPINGCILSNELVDNFSIHQVVMGDQLMEVYVGCENGEFKEILLPADHSLVNYFNELNVVLPYGFRTEVNLEAITWITNVTSLLKKGYVITIDYGFPSSELYRDHHRSGNLVCYHRHRVNFSPYHHIGLQDITAHVNFSALHHWGIKNGLALTGYTNQAQFLLGLGIARCHLPDDDALRASDFLRTWLLGFGKKMKVLIQQKNVLKSFLSGLQFRERLI